MGAASQATRSTDVTSSDSDLEASAPEDSEVAEDEAASACAAATFARRSLFF
jgi:hypothetical protein